jgi:hypothetical protein
MRVGSNIIRMREFFAAMLALAALAGCTQTKALLDPPMPPLTASEKAALLAAVPPVTREKSVLLTRVTYGSNECAGSIRLTPVIDGRLVPEKAERVGYHLGNVPQRFIGLGSLMVNMVTLDIAGLKKDTAADRWRASFHAIAPGDYVVTHVDCGHGNYTVTMGGSRLLSLLGAGAATPIRGDNFIRVPPGQLVDAGTLDVTILEPGLLSSTATLVGKVLSAEQQAQLSRDFPSLHAKMSFSRFTAFSPR